MNPTRRLPLDPAPPKGRVYLVHQPSVARRGPQPDLNKLAPFGELVTVIRTGEHVTRDPRRALRLIHDRMKDFDAETDYVVWVGGDTLAAILVGVVLADQGHDAVRWLWLDRPKNSDGSRDDARGEYRPMFVPLFLEDQRAHDENHA